MEWRISNATLVYKDKIEKVSGFTIQDGYIAKPPTEQKSEIDLPDLNLHGLFVLPGLVNSHERLMASYYMFEGSHHPYNNWLAWDNELKSSSLFRQRILLDPVNLYQLGSYRNIFSGVTTVVDHVPRHVYKPFTHQVLPRLLTDFGISHSLCSYSLDWGQGIRQEYEYAVANDLPYIIHIAEGFDRESRDSLAKLDDLAALGKNTVLVHGLSLSPQDLDRIAKAGAHLVWCPVSNYYLYQKTMPIKEILERGINVCLGSNGAMYGSTNLLCDISFCRKYYQEQYDEDLGPECIFDMVTANPQRAFRLKNHGNLEAGSHADFIVLKGKYPDDPMASFQEGQLEELYLVVIGGQPVYGHECLEDLFSLWDNEENEDSCFEYFTLRDERRIIKRKALAETQSLKNLINQVGIENSLDFMPIGTP